MSGSQDLFTRLASTAKRPGLVLMHEASVADGIGSQDGGQTAINRVTLQPGD